MPHAPHLQNHAFDKIDALLTDDDSVRQLLREVFCSNPLSKVRVRRSSFSENQASILLLVAAEESGQAHGAVPMREAGQA